MALTGRDVYNKLMDINLDLSDIDKMGPLCMFLGSITPDNEGLVALNREINAFKRRLDTLIFISKPPLDNPNSN